MEKEVNYFVNESVYLDDGCVIGKGTKVWNFSLLINGSTLGETCDIGQNVVVSPKVTLGNNVRVKTT